LHDADTKIFKPEDINMNIFDGATIVDDIYTKLLLLDPINDSDILLSHQRKMDRVEQASFAFTQASWSAVTTPMSQQQSTMSTPTDITTPAAAVASPQATNTRVKDVTSFYQLLGAAEVKIKDANDNTVDVQLHRGCLSNGL
jgi:hypothetical protein